jgi:hypothetical protein
MTLLSLSLSLSLSFLMLKFLEGFLFRDQLYKIFRIRCVRLQGVIL